MNRVCNRVIITLLGFRISRPSLRDAILGLTMRLFAHFKQIEHVGFVCHERAAATKSFGDSINVFLKLFDGGLLRETNTHLQAPFL